MNEPKTKLFDYITKTELVLYTCASLFLISSVGGVVNDYRLKKEITSRDVDMCMTSYDSKVAGLRDGHSMSVDQCIALGQDSNFDSAACVKTQMTN